MSAIALFLSVLAIVLIAGDWGRRLVRRRRSVSTGVMVRIAIENALSPNQVRARESASSPDARAERLVSPGEFAVIPCPGDEVSQVDFSQIGQKLGEASAKSANALLRDAESHGLLPCRRPE